MSYSEGNVGIFILLQSQETNLFRGFGLPKCSQQFWTFPSWKLRGMGPPGPRPV